METLPRVRLPHMAGGTIHYTQVVPEQNRKTVESTLHSHPIPMWKYLDGWSLTAFTPTPCPGMAGHYLVAL